MCSSSFKIGVYPNASSITYFRSRAPKWLRRLNIPSLPPRFVHLLCSFENYHWIVYLDKYKKVCDWCSRWCKGRKLWRDLLVNIGTIREDVGYMRANLVRRNRNTNSTKSTTKKRKEKPRKPQFSLNFQFNSGEEQETIATDKWEVRTASQHGEAKIRSVSNYTMPTRIFCRLLWIVTKERAMKILKKMHLVAVQVNAMAHSVNNPNWIVANYLAKYNQRLFARNFMTFIISE